MERTGRHHPFGVHVPTRSPPKCAYGHRFPRGGPASRQTRMAIIALIRLQASSLLHAPAPARALPALLHASIPPDIGRELQTVIRGWVVDTLAGPPLSCSPATSTTLIMR